MLSAAPFELPTAPSPAWFETVSSPANDFQLIQSLPVSGELGDDVEPVEIDTAHWIVQLNDEGLEQFHSPAEMAGAFADSDIDIRVLRGLGLPGQVLVGTGCAAVPEIEAALAALPFKLDNATLVAELQVKAARAEMVQRLARKANSSAPIDWAALVRDVDGGADARREFIGLVKYVQLRGESTGHVFRLVFDANFVLAGTIFPDGRTLRYTEEGGYREVGYFGFDVSTNPVFRTKQAR